MEELVWYLDEKLFRSGQGSYGARGIRYHAHMTFERRDDAFHVSRPGTRNAGKSVVYALPAIPGTAGRDRYRISIASP